MVGEGISLFKRELAWALQNLSLITGGGRLDVDSLIGQWPGLIVTSSSAIEPSSAESNLPSKVM